MAIFARSYLQFTRSNSIRGKVETKMLLSVKKGSQRN